VQGIERDQMACEAKLGEQRLGGGDLVRLLGDVAVRQHQRGVCGEDAEQLRGGAVAELIEAAAQGLAIDGQAGPARLGATRLGATRAGAGRLGAGRLQQAGMTAKGDLQRAAIEALKDVADRGVRRRAPPLQAEGPVQAAPMHLDEGDDAAIRVAAADDRQDREQQHVRQRVDLALRPAWVRHGLQQPQQR
jgi:hypothetical protein